MGFLASHEVTMYAVVEHIVMMIVVVVMMRSGMRWWHGYSHFLRLHLLLSGLIQILISHLNWDVFAIDLLEESTSGRIAHNEANPVVADQTLQLRAP